MPISSKYLKVLRGMVKQYCTSKYGAGGRKDKPVQGVSTCPKARQVFYATMNKRGIDYTLELGLSEEEIKELSLTGEDIARIATESIIEESEPEELTEPKYIRIRVQAPDQFHAKSFRIITIGNDIRTIIGCPKGASYTGGKCHNGTQVQAVLFPKSKYTKGEAKSWVAKHKYLKKKR